MRGSGVRNFAWEKEKRLTMVESQIQMNLFHQWDLGSNWAIIKTIFWWSFLSFSTTVKSPHQMKIFSQFFEKQIIFMLLKICCIFLEAETDVFLGPSQGGREGTQGVLRGWINQLAGGVVTDLGEAWLWNVSTLCDITMCWLLEFHASVQLSLKMNLAQEGKGRLSLVA